MQQEVLKEGMLLLLSSGNVPRDTINIYIVLFGVIVLVEVKDGRASLAFIKEIRCTCK